MASYVPRVIPEVQAGLWTGELTNELQDFLASMFPSLRPSVNGSILNLRDSGGTSWNVHSDHFVISSGGRLLISPREKFLAKYRELNDD